VGFARDDQTKASRLPCVAFMLPELEGTTASSPTISIVKQPLSHYELHEFPKTSLGYQAFKMEFGTSGMLNEGSTLSHELDFMVNS
jgi:hypothetical protein